MSASPRSLAEPPPVSVAMTVLNEGSSLKIFLESLLEQTHAPAEIVICDGGSVDDTMAILRATEEAWQHGGPPIRVISRPGANISQGRNTAIEECSSSLIAVTDAGIRLEKDWLEQLVLTFSHESDDPDVKGAAGFFLPEPVGVFETSLAGTTMPFRRDVDASEFLPAGRSMLFRREAWKEIDGFPEWLDYCEDLVFDMQLEDLAAGRRKALPLAEFSVVRVRPRSGYRQFYKQYFLYARGDGKADLWAKRHLVRYGVYILLIPWLLRLMTSRNRRSRFWGRLLTVIGVFAYCRRPVERVWKMGRNRLGVWRVLAALLQIPLIRLVGDAAKMLGYPMGWLWRIRNWKRAEIHWRANSCIRSARGKRSSPA